MKGTEKRIVEAAIQLFKEKGYENTSVAEICKVSHVTKGTFYYHYANKDDLTFAYYEGLFDDMADTMSDLLFIENAKDQLWRLLEYSIDNTISLTPPLLKAFIMSDIQKGMTFFSPYKSFASSESRRRQYTMQIGLIKKGQKTGEIKSGDPAMMLHTFISALIGIAVDWASNDGCYDEKEELRKVFDTIF